MNTVISINDYQLEKRMKNSEQNKARLAESEKGVLRSLFLLQQRIIKIRLGRVEL